MKPFIDLRLFLKQKKVVTLGRLFSLVLAGEVEFVADFKKSLNEKDFISLWIKQMNSVAKKQLPTLAQKPAIKKVAYLPRSVTIEQQQVIFSQERNDSHDEKYLTVSQIKHLPTYGKCIPSFNISKILLPIFKALGYQFDDGFEFEFIWNVLLQFDKLQMILLEIFNIAPVKGQAKSPLANAQFGSLQDFLSLDLICRQQQTKDWGAPIEKYGYSFNGRPWKFLCNETTMFEERNIPGISLFEQLLTFAMGNSKSVVNLSQHPFFQQKKASITLLAHHLILCVLFGNQIEIEHDFQPTQFKEFTCATVPKVRDYFLNIMKDVRPISVSTCYFKHNNIFGEVELDLLSHPGNKKTYVWIQKIENDRYKLFLFPKVLEKKENDKTLESKMPNNLQTMTMAAFSSTTMTKTNKMVFRACEIEDNTLVAIKNTDKKDLMYRMMPTKEYKDLKMNQPSLCICFMTNMTEQNVLETMIAFAKSLVGRNVIVYKNAPIELMEEDNDIQVYSPEDQLTRKIVIMDNKTAQTIKFEEINFFLIPDTVKNFHYFTSVPQGGYLIISSEQTVGNLNVTSMQNLFFAKKQYKSLISHYDFLADLSVRIVSKSQLTSDREQQDREYEQLVKDETTKNNKQTQKRVRPCENSSLLKNFFFKCKKRSLYFFWQEEENKTDEKHGENYCCWAIYA